MHFQATRTSGVVKNVFLAFPGHQNQVLKKDIFQRMEWLKTCFDAFRDHQNQVLKKDNFNVWRG
jgi:hypothetical protein